MTTMTVMKQDLMTFLVGQGLARDGEGVHWEPLAGGVSSDIWRVDLPGRSICVKRALPQLRTESEWVAPVSRNAYEWAWMEFAAKQCPANVPRPLAHDSGAGLFAMSYLPAEDYPVWKRQLMDGHVDIATASAVGRIVGCLHAKSAGRGDLAAEFDTIENFRSLRLEPYFLAAAVRNPAVALNLLEISERTERIRLALVHGDVSPKNILVGPRGPVLLDAECAWYGDPAFDLAFCLNHLLLKSLVRPDRSAVLLTSFEALADAYLEQVNWESRRDLERRAAALLGAMLLARVDGKSPVEYLTKEPHKAFVRYIATDMLLNTPENLFQIAAKWWSSVLLN